MNVNSPLIKTRKIFILIILLAAVLRLWGIWHGYPYSYYPDEAHFVKRSLSFGSGDFNPHWFHKPAFYMYIIFFEYGIFFILGKIMGFWQSVTDFAVFYIINPGPFYLIGRFTTFLFGLGSIWITYECGERHFSRGTGIWASLLLTFCYGHVFSSQHIKADIPTTFFTILSIHFMLHYITTYKDKELYLSAAIAGIGAATKVYPLVMLFPLTLSTVWVNYQMINKLNMLYFYKTCLRIVAIVAVFFFLYFICSPYSFIDPLGRVWTFGPFTSVLKKLSSLFVTHTESSPGAVLSQKMGFMDGVVDYIIVLMGKTGMGPAIAIIGFMGSGYLLVKREIKYILFLVFPVLFILFSAYQSPGYADPRHQLPIYPALCLAGAFLINEIKKKFVDKKFILYVIILACIGYSLIYIVEHNLLVSRVDTRNLAKEWIEKNIPAKSKLLLDEVGPHLLFCEESLKPLLIKAKKADPKGQFTAHYDFYIEYQILASKKAVTYNIKEIRKPWWRKDGMENGEHHLETDYDKDFGNPLKPVGVETYDYYLKNGYKYAIVNSIYYARFFKNNQVSKNFPSFTRFYQELFKKAELIKEFSPNDGNRPGPTIKIFKMIAVL